MMFDASAWVGIWPFTAARPTSLADLVRDLQAVDVSGGAISPLNAVLGPDPMLANRDLLAELETLPAGSFDARFVPVFDPSLPGWEHDLAALAASGRLAGIRIVPSYHGYDVDGPDALALAGAVRDLGVPLIVQVRLYDERAHHPLMKVPAVPVAGIARLAGAVPDLRIVVAGIFQAELTAIADVPNVWAEVSSIESADALGNAVAAIGVERLLLGTHAPLYIPAVSVAKVQVSGVSAADRERIGSTNAATLFSLADDDGDITMETTAE